MPEDMAFVPVARSLISGKAPVHGIATLDPVEGSGTLNLRLPDAESRALATGQLGVAVPEAANTFASRGEVMVLWLGPDEWLVQAPLPRIAALHGALEQALAGRHVAVTEVSDHSVAMELSGQGARRVLEKGCPVDLHPRAFAPGCCAQSHFLQAGVLIAQIDTDRYLLRVRRSMAEYLWDALADAVAKG